MRQACFRDGYTPVTASTAVALGNLLLRERGGEEGAESSGGQRTSSQRVVNAKTLPEATELLAKAAAFYSTRVEAALAFGECGRNTSKVRSRTMTCVGGRLN